MVAIGPGEATVGGSSILFYFILFYFISDLHTDLVNRKTFVQQTQKDMAADSAG